MRPDDFGPGGDIPADVAAIPIPGWLETDMAEKGLAPAWREVVRRLYRASQWRIQLRMRQTGATSLQALLDMDAARERDEALREAGIPPLLLEQASGKLDITDAMAWAQLMLDVGVKRGQCLVLCGPTGVGKSTAAAWLVRELVAQGYRPRWEYAPELFARLHMGEIQHHTITVAPVLIIDDLGAEDEPRARAKFDTVIYYRHAARRPTVITTNLRPEALAERYGSRVVDRLQEWGPVVQVVAESMRQPVGSGSR